MLNAATREARFTMARTAVTTAKSNNSAKAESRVKSVLPGRLSGSDAALYLGLATQTLANWRNLGRGPKYMRQGRLHGRIYYRISDLDAWIEEDHEELD